MESATLNSRLEIYNINTQKRRLVLAEESHFEAPNWSRCGQYLVINKDGLLYEVHLDEPKLKLINTEFATRCNNDHGISPDGLELVISHHAPDNGSVIYRLPIQGGTPQRMTMLWPSYWHGWSPDGRYLAYVAGRGAHSDFKIYRLDLDSKIEEQLTFGEGLDDGPDYSACGKYIYFNGYRENRMQIWRMDADGKNPQHFIHSTCSDWFPHPSPDGKKLIFIRYLVDQGQAHPFGCDVQIMLHDLITGQTTAATEVFYGGQGSLNVPCWSPDSSEFAFVTYEKIVR
jgi:TolB protein